jgi:hypothetical protein
VCVACICHWRLGSFAMHVNGGVSGLISMLLE